MEKHVSWLVVAHRLHQQNGAMKAIQLVTFCTACHSDFVPEPGENSWPPVLDSCPTLRSRYIAVAKVGRIHKSYAGWLPGMNSIVALHLYPRCAGTQHGDNCVAQCQQGYTGKLACASRFPLPQYLLQEMC